MAGIKRKRQAEPFSMVPIAVMEHPAYATAGYFERVVLHVLAAEYRGYNNGAIALTFGQARDRFGIKGQNRFYEALGDLEWRGLIRRTWAGRLKQFSDGPSRYLLEWRDHNEFPQYNIKQGPATNAWQYWTPERPRHPRKRPGKKRSLPTRGHGKGAVVPARGDGKPPTAPTSGDGNCQTPYPRVVPLIESRGGVGIPINTQRLQMTGVKAN